MNDKEDPRIIVDCADISCGNCVYGTEGKCEVVTLDEKYGIITPSSSPSDTPFAIAHEDIPKGGVGKISLIREV